MSFLPMKKKDNRSYIGMIIQSTTLDTEDKVKEIYGGETWIEIEGKFLLGHSSSYAIGTTGGEVNHTLSIAEMPAHGHTQNWLRKVGHSADGSVHFLDPGASYASVTTGSTGGGQAHNNMPPYEVVYMWKRTA